MLTVVEESPRENGLATANSLNWLRADEAPPVVLDAIEAV